VGVAEPDAWLAPSRQNDVMDGTDSAGHRAGDAHLARRSMLAALVYGATGARDAAARPTAPLASARVAWLAGSAGPLPTPAYLDAMRSGLRERGWEEGRNCVVDVRWGDRASASALTAELLRLRPDVLVAQGAMVLAAREVESTVPIVFGFSGDPVEAGLVASFARPGGRLTGVAMQSLELVGKRLELLSELMPQLRLVAILANPAHPGERLELEASRAAARRLGLEVLYHPVTSARELDAALAAVVQERAQALVAFPDALIMSQAAAIAAFARRHRVPAVSGWSEFADEGNLLTYGPNLRQTWHQAAGFVDRLLRGARPAVLPVEQPAHYELVVNLQAAAALSLKLPPTLTMRAERLIR
jgi:putative ABC transport system substrate-binding protein